MRGHPRPLTRPAADGIVFGFTPHERGSKMPTATMKAPFYGHVRQYHNIKKELDDAILKVLESNQYVMGPALKQFEQDLAKYFGTKHAIGVANGTDALWLTFMALGLQPGDEVITNANTFFA